MVFCCSICTEGLEEAYEILMLEPNIKESKARINKANVETALRNAEIKELEETKTRIEAELAELTENDMAQVEDVNTIQESNEAVAGPSRLKTQNKVEPGKGKRDSMPRGTNIGNEGQTEEEPQTFLNKIRDTMNLLVFSSN